MKEKKVDLLDSLLSETDDRDAQKLSAFSYEILYFSVNIKDGANPFACLKG
jgi:hypothetical protein